jgi:acyl carrier protein
MTPAAPAAADLELRLKRLIVDRLKLEIDPGTIDTRTPLFGPEGLRLDSIDALEIVLGLEQEFGIKVADQEMGARQLESIDAIAALVRSKQQASG